jgi:hypothetical protein
MICNRFQRRGRCTLYDDIRHISLWLLVARNPQRKARSRCTTANVPLLLFQWHIFSSVALEGSEESLTSSHMISRPCSDSFVAIRCVSSFFFRNRNRNLNSISWQKISLLRRLLLQLLLLTLFSFENTLPREMPRLIELLLSVSFYCSLYCIDSFWSCELTVIIFLI